MHDQSIAGGQVGDEIFTAAVQRPYDGSFKPRGKARREQRPQSPPTNEDTLEAGAFHGRAQLPHLTFDFGEFGHRAIVAKPRPGGRAL